jgi:hypothetical protein
MRMDDWRAPKSNARIILGLILIVAAFLWLTYFYNYLSSTYPHTSPDRLTGWFGAIIACSLFFSSFCIGFNVKTKKAVIGFLFFIVWSYGLVLLPIPEGYGEAVLGGWAILFMAFVTVYAKYEQWKKNKKGHDCTNSNVCGRRGA